VRLCNPSHQQQAWVSLAAFDAAQVREINWRGLALVQQVVSVAKQVSQESSISSAFAFDLSVLIRGRS